MRVIVLASVVFVSVWMACESDNGKSESDSQSERTTDADWHVEGESEERPRATDPSFRTEISQPFGLDEAATDIGLVDIDGDGDLDAFTVSGYGAVFNENIGTSKKPNFRNGVDGPFGFDTKTKGIGFVDIDADGDKDVFTVSGYGVNFHENVGTSKKPNFKNKVHDSFGFDAKATGIDFVDIDGDGDQDAFTVSGYGVLFHENMGTSKKPNFKNGTDDPFGLDTKAMGIVFADIDADGDEDAFTVSGYGASFHENVGISKKPNFKNGVDDPFGLETEATGIDLADIDADGDIDVFTVSGYGPKFSENNNL